MVNIFDVLQLSDHYKIGLYYPEKTDDELAEIIRRMKLDIEEIVHPSHEYPIFPFYIVLQYLNGTYINWDNCSDKDKQRYVEDTIAEIERMSKDETFRKMLGFMQESWSCNMPYRRCSAAENNTALSYTFNYDRDGNSTDYMVLADMLGYKSEREVVGCGDGREYKVTIYFK